MRLRLLSLLVIPLMLLSAFTSIPSFSASSVAQLSSSPSQLVEPISDPVNASVYGVGLSGAPVVLDEPTLVTMTGGPTTVAAFKSLIAKYFVPMDVKLVFVDIGWGNAPNTTTTQVAGGYASWLNNWLYATNTYSINNLFFTKQFGYFFSSPSWDQTLLNVYPSSKTVNSSGVYVPLVSCSGCTTASGWTITSPVVQRQYEQDLKQLFVWYGNYTNWIGFGEGATGDRNEYVNPGTALKTARPWDNGTMLAFANSLFFQRSISTTGTYTGSSNVSKIWAEFLNDRPDIAVNTGVPLVYPSLSDSYSPHCQGQCLVYGKHVLLQRFYVPQTLKGFKLSAFMESDGSPLTSMYETIYPDNTSLAMQSAPIRSKPLANQSVSGVSGTAGWVSTTFSSTTLIGEDYYWVAFTFNGASASSSNYYAVDSDQQNVFPDIQVWSGTNGVSTATDTGSGSVLWLKSLADANITIYPYFNQGANQAGGTVTFQVPNTVRVNTVSFMFSDRAYDPNNITVSLEFSSNSSVLSTGMYSIFTQRGVSTISELPIQLSPTVTLYSGTNYKIVTSSLSNDNYAGSSGGGVTQDYITETANPASAGYLGQATWPTMQLGLMQIEAGVLSSNVNVGKLRGVAYNQGWLDLYCTPVRTGTCDNSLVPIPSVVFPAYKASGFNVARISPMNWYYSELNLSAIETKWAAVANACDANGVYCYYLFSPSYENIPPDVYTAIVAAGDTVAQAFANNIVLGSGTYSGQHIWDALYNGLLYPLLQTVDSHSSTLGYEILNEPGSGWSTSSIHAYYDYELALIRSYGSIKNFFFQTNAGGDGDIVADAPLSSLGPYVFELHNYQAPNVYNPYPSVQSDCVTAGCAGMFLGEWGGSTNSSSLPAGYSTLTQWLNASIAAPYGIGMGNEWYSSVFPENNVTGAFDTVVGTALAASDVAVMGAAALASGIVSNYNYLGSTDLEYSPGKNGNNQVALRFKPTSSGALTGFSVEVVNAPSLSNVLNVTLRPNNNTCQAGISGTCSHPAHKASSLAYGTVAFSTVNATFHTCSGAYNGVCAWANVTFTGTTSLTAGTYYWLVLNTTGSKYMQLERLVGPYKALTYVSANDFATSWGPPNDGPSDISFQITTSAGDINNTIQGDTKLSLGTVAQSFNSSTTFQLKGLWLPTSIGSNAIINVTIRSNNSTKPSNTMLAQGVIQQNTPGNSLNYVSLNFPVNVTANTKYWFTMTFQCLVASCSSSPNTLAIVYRSDALAQSYGAGLLYYETYSGGVWSTPSQKGSIIFVLVGSDSTIKTYKTSVLYTEVANHEDSVTTYAPIGQWNTFLDLTQSQIMYNLTQSMTAYYGRSFIWYTGMPAKITSLLSNANYNYILTTYDGTGGPIGCPPTVPSCGGSLTLWPDDAKDQTQAILGYPQQSSIYPWLSFGSTHDNQGALTPIDLRTYYSVNLPMYATSILAFNDWTWDSVNHGIQNMTQTQVITSFGNILSRMQNAGGYYGTNKNAVRVLYIGTSNDGFFPQFLTSALNITYDYGDTNLNLFAGSINQFKVIAVDPSILTSAGLATLTTFVKNGGGLVENNFGETASVQDNLIGLKTNSSSATTTSTLTIQSANKITSPYSSMSWTAYWLKYKISALGNESASILVKDSNGNPYVVTNSYYSGKVVLLEATVARPSQVGNAHSFDGTTYGSPQDSWISLFINSVFYAAGKSSMLPILWDSSYNVNQGWSPYLQYSIDGSLGQPVLLWLTNNDSSSSLFSIHLNATFYNIDTAGWIAVNMQNMSVVAKGTGSNISISTHVAPYDWLPIYIMNNTASSLAALYTTENILASASNSFTMQGPLNASSWLVLHESTSVTSVTSNFTGSISSKASLALLNATTIGYTCIGIVADQCVIFHANSQEGYYYDSSNSLLYIHFRTGNAPTKLTISAAASPNPQFANPNTNSTQASTKVRFQITMTDPVGISGYIFSYDSGSGTFTNNSFASVGGSPTSYVANATKTLASTIGERVQWVYYFNDTSNVWGKSYSFAFVAGGSPASISSTSFTLISDDAYDILAYDGTHLANLGNFPQLVQTSGSAVGFHSIFWNPQMTQALVSGYNNSLVLYTKSNSSSKVLVTGISTDSDINGIAWAHNGTSAIVSARTPDHILTFSISTGFTSVSNPTSVTAPSVARWNPVSNYALIVGSNGLMKFTNGAPLTSIASASGFPWTGLDFNPNGTLAILANSNGGVWKYNNATSSISLIRNVTGITNFQQIRFSKNGAYALITAQSGSPTDLYQSNSVTVTAVNSASSNTANQISFVGNDSYALTTTTGGTLVKIPYNSNSTTLVTLTSGATTRLRGIDFFVQPSSTTTTITSTITSVTTTTITVTPTGWLIPLYSYPTDSSWANLISIHNSKPTVPIIAIINPNDGPGASSDANFVTGINNLRAAGITVAGYVPTNYGAFSTGSVEANITLYHGWYNINAMLFDEMASIAGKESYYTTLTAFAASNGFMTTIGGAGTSVASSYIGTVSIINIYENSGLPLVSTIASATSGGERGNFSMVAYNVAGGKLNQTIVNAYSAHVAWISFTDANLPNPYTVLPTYLSTALGYLTSTTVTITASATTITSTVNSQVTTTTTYYYEIFITVSVTSTITITETTIA